MLSKSFAPPLRTRLDGTIFKSAPNSRQKSISPTYRSIQRPRRPEQVRGYISPKIGDRWRLSQVDSHSHRKLTKIPPRTGPTHTSRTNSPLEYVAQGRGVHLILVSHRIPTELGWNLLLYY